MTERRTLIFDSVIGLKEQLTIAKRQLAEAERFARDIANKLGIPYEPPVTKGECAYLRALETLKERAEKAEKEVERLRDELCLIANSHTASFEIWARSRARHALNLEAGTLTIKKA